ncbi:hypothetical protein EON77_15805 [bacterium]|nr:MAG: hypothetical protein EON77_15805 [bacterium]
MRWLNQILVLYSAIMILLGFQGYFMAHSLPSLIGGVAIGLLMLGSVALSLTNPRPARIGAAILSLAVLVWFTRGYVENRNFFPAGFIVILTFIVLGCLVAGHFMGMLARRERGRETLPAAFAEKQAREREESAAPRSEPKV